MLESVRFKNFKSFAVETLIDLKPSKVEYLEGTNIYNGFLKGCSFYGSNASGKTNALNAITLLWDVLFGNGTINQNLFTKFNNEKKMWFEYNFAIDESKIKYEIEFNRDSKVTSEKLFLDNELLLNRTITSAKSYITENQDYEDIDSYSLFLRSIYFNTRFNGFPKLKKWFEFLQKSLYFNPQRAIAQIVSFDPKINQDIYLETYLEKYGDKEINDFLKKAGFNYRIKYEKRYPFQMVPFSGRLFILRDNLTPIPFFLESQGNVILFSFLPSYLTIIKNGGILAIDEFSSGLHNDLEEYLVKYFFENSKEAQIIFVSHSTSILKTSIIRPDQVYAVDFVDNSSRISKFSSRGMRESQNMEKMYLSGVFGGIPQYEDNTK